jgi:hypothetical protein
MDIGTPQQGLTAALTAAGNDGTNDYTGPSGPASQRPTLSDKLPRPWLFPLLSFATVWVLFIAIWKLANLYYHTSHGWTWYFWYKDATLYGSVAYSWYAQSPHSSGAPIAAAFFPLFPALIRACYYLAFGNLTYGGLIAVVLSGGASTVTVWALASRVRDRWTADRAVILFCAFPGAMMLGVMYSESLGIALVAGCLLAAVKEKWFLAGLAALLATAEHPTFIVLVPTLGVCALRAVWVRRDWRSLIAPALAPLGMVGYFAWIGTRYHDYHFWFQLEHTLWRQRIDWGRTTFNRLTFHWKGSWAANHGDYQLMCDIMFWLLVIGIVLMLVERVPLPVSLYTVLLFITVVIDSGGGPRPRFAWTAIGIFIGAAARLPRWLFWPVALVSAAGMFFLYAWWPYHPGTNP